MVSIISFHAVNLKCTLETLNKTLVINHINACLSWKLYDGLSERDLLLEFELQVRQLICFSFVPDTVNAVAAPQLASQLVFWT